MNLDIVGRIRKENEKRGWTVYRLAKEANLSSFNIDEYDASRELVHH